MGTHLPTYFSGTVEEGDKYRSKTEKLFRIKQGSDVNRTEIGRPKVTNIDYNTVKPFLFVEGK